MKRKIEHLSERERRERERAREREIKKEKKTRKETIKEIGRGKVKNQPGQGDSEQEKYGRRYPSWITSIPEQLQEFSNGKSEGQITLKMRKNSAFNIGKSEGK